MRCAAFAICLTLTACATPAADEAALAQGDEYGSPARGSLIAEAVCAECHAIRAGDPISPNLEAPAFADIAATPGITNTALQAWMRSDHPTMPDFVLEPEQVDDLYAYLSTLRAR